MDLRLYDTASREKRPFVPLDPKNVRMYVCGPTVYDFAHIGNARPVIVFDVLFRLLRHVYGKDHVTYVRNITDVDDKINARAARDFPGLPLNEAIRKVTEVTANQFHSDTAALGSLSPTFEPRATDFVLPRSDGKADMVTLIRQLIARGHAYEAGGEVLFDTQSMPDYGALSGRKLEDQLAGARVAVDAHKKNPADFVLWKQSSEDEPGWDSPWGRGRPGWHIECSAMSAAYLGEVFDIHGGGLDLIFPHHENEIAQSRCAHGTSVMANYWLHNEFVQVEGAKMSKSLGNFVTIRDLLVDWPGEVLRLNMLKMHYRSPADWTVKGLEESAKTLDDWYRVAADAPGETPEPAVIAALLDDINTPLMIAELHALRGRAASGGDAERAAFAGSLRYVGFLSDTAAQWEARKQAARGVDAAKVERLIAERTAARARKDFKESDRLRDELVAMGVVLKDGKGADGKPVTTWEIAR
ncbi:MULTISPECIES: cysteine--tRNA ligase [unclassified Bradyrhizobium]|uniref:cysteine--tRNA ligase n=1 Tax=unclassified Bradyrhizobium TaxID=2631580 RepID=UPI0024E12512|nr:MULTISPECIES: cysteine--tRNA ligase [unclassified Bradyrhizobium]